MYIRSHQRYYHLMLLPCVALLLVFYVVPFFGNIIAFEKFVPAKGVLGSTWVGLDNYRRLLRFADFWQAVRNTICISVAKMVLGIIVPVAFALVLNECHALRFKKLVQTIVYLPHFMSWVILAVIFNNMFSATGLVNQLVTAMGGKAQLWMINSNAFPHILVWTETWKEFGYGAIVYLAAITAINPELYEAADMDGATRLQKVRHITLPSIVPTMILMATLALRNVLNGGFDQVFNMYSPLVYSTGDIIDTYIYRMCLVNLQFSMSAAVSLIKSLIGFVLIVFSYFCANRYAGYTIF